jgi:hypothetical protein
MGAIIEYILFENLNQDCSLQGLGSSLLIPKEPYKLLYFVVEISTTNFNKGIKNKIDMANIHKGKARTQKTRLSTENNLRGNANEN